MTELTWGIVNRDGDWMIARHVDPTLADVAIEYWCGRHGWCSPCSSAWATNPSIEPEFFATARDALRFASRELDLA